MVPWIRESVCVVGSTRFAQSFSDHEKLQYDRKLRQAQREGIGKLKRDVQY